MSRYGVDVKPDNVLVTSGSQQALDLIGKLLINPGDRVLDEAPTYMGALQAFNAYQADYLAVPIDDDGMDVGRSRSSCGAGPSSSTRFRISRTPPASRSAWVAAGASSNARRPAGSRSSRTTRTGSSGTKASIFPPS